MQKQYKQSGRLTLLPALALVIVAGAGGYVGLQPLGRVRNSISATSSR